MTYIIEFKNGQWLRVSEEQGIAIQAGLQKGVQWVSIDGNMYASNTITKIEKSV